MDAFLDSIGSFLLNILGGVVAFFVVVLLITLIFGGIICFFFQYLPEKNDARKKEKERKKEARKKEEEQKKEYETIKKAEEQIRKSDFYRHVLNHCCYAVDSELKKIPYTCRTQKPSEWNRAMYINLDSFEVTFKYSLSQYNKSYSDFGYERVDITYRFRCVLIEDLNQKFAQKVVCHYDRDIIVDFEKEYDKHSPYKKQVY